MLWHQMKAALARFLNPAEAATIHMPTAPAPDSDDKERPNDKPDQVTQLLLKLHYQQLVQQGLPLPGFRDVQFKAHSQTGEDGLLLYVFAVIGTTNKRCVEICAGAGIECNTANLIINHGWTGLLVDGDDAKLQRGREFYRECQSTSIWPPYLTNRWVTRENVNTILQEMNYSGQIDLLSLDLDGNDYWIWDAIDIIDPRVVILEYQSAWGPEKRVTQRYQENFSFLDVKVKPGFPRCGASLAAFVSLGRKKGYRLVGCNHLCFNAIFIKQGTGEAHFPEIPAQDCFEHDMPNYRMAIIEGKDIPLPDMWETV
jgi:hypothetical protein